jgi:hypothetical protein
MMSNVQEDGVVNFTQDEWTRLRKLAPEAYKAIRESNFMLLHAPVVEEAPATKAHWAIIKADNMVIAQGYCECSNPDADKHSITKADWR